MFSASLYHCAPLPVARKSKLVGIHFVFPQVKFWTDIISFDCNMKSNFGQWASNMPHERGNFDSLKSPRTFQTVQEFSTFPHPRSHIVQVLVSVRRMNEFTLVFVKLRRHKCPTAQMRTCFVVHGNEPHIHSASRRRCTQRGSLCGISAANMLP